MSTIKITFDTRELDNELSQLDKSLNTTRPLMLAVAETLHAQAMAIFHSEGATVGGWPTLSKSTQRNRARNGHWPGKMLQVTGRLAASIQTDAGDDFAQIGTNAVYAAIQHFGGVINRTGTVRLRTEAAGSLKRQRGHKNLAVFARRRHKRAVVRAVNYQIHIPARPIFPVTPEGQLTTAALNAVINVLKNRLAV